MHRLGLLFVLCWIVYPLGAGAQDSTTVPPDTSRGWQEDAWTDIVARKSVTVSYIFYQKADTQNDGIVLRLRNRNAHPVRYAFTILFRGPEGSTAAEAAGTVPADSIRVGDQAGLFWIPFEDGRTIGEVGLRGLSLTRVPKEEDPSASHR